MSNGETIKKSLPVMASEMVGSLMMFNLTQPDATELLRLAHELARDMPNDKWVNPLLGTGFKLKDKVEVQK